MSLLSVNKLSQSFDYTLFNDISFSLQARNSMAVVGVSGSGKSTLLHICSTLLKPNKGEVKLFNQDLYSLKDKDILKIRREDIGIIFQSHYLFKGFSAFENIELATLLNDTQIDNKLIKKFGIEKLLNQKVSELSGGQQQRVSIARVLAKKPKILFADEPTGNLDSQTANEVMDVIFDYIKENDAALLLVTHDMDLARRCDEVMRLEVDGIKAI